MSQVKPLSCFFFFFLIIDLYFLIPAVIAQIFSPITELVTLILIPTKEAKAEIETHPRSQIKPYKPFWASYSSIHFSLFLQ